MKDGEIVILNVNDSASNRYYVTRVLRSAGWTVLEAMTGAEGLELAREHRPDLIVLDIKLPDMSGLDVCRQLKHDPRTSDILIIQTAKTLDDAERAKLERETAAILKKQSLSREVAMTRIREALEAAGVRGEHTRAV